MFTVLDVVMTRRALAGSTLAVTAAVAAIGGFVSETRASSRPAGFTTLRARTTRSTAGNPVFTAAAATAATDEPLQSTEWWRADVHVDTLSPPGPGVPITIVDTGIDFAHQEFVGRPDLIPLNNQEPAGIGGVHGTAVASVAGASANGVGLLGLYPTATIRSYDASLGDGTRLPSSDIAAGIAAAAAAGRSVINLSLGGNTPDAAIESAVAQAVRTGSLVVAASGNSGLDGNPLSYPGASPHVLTVAATDQNDQVAPFSSQSPFVDISAPGVDIPVATALDNSYAPESGTSFASPMVAAAAAWLWTVRPTLDASQVAEILRRSARDIGTPGYDVASGYGILDLSAALLAPTPLSDPGEPNDEVASARTVTTQLNPSGRASGRVAAFDDPRDDLRIWVPKGKRLTVTGTTGSTVALSLLTTGSAQLAHSSTTTGKPVLAYRNAGAGRTAFIVVAPAHGVRTSDYALTFTVK
jgi:hypothetical protein